MSCEVLGLPWSTFLLFHILKQNITYLQEELSKWWTDKNLGNLNPFQAKSVQIRSYFWSVFSCIRTEYGEILRISPYSVRMWENTDQEKLRIWTLLTLCWSKLTIPIYRVAHFISLYILPNILKLSPYSVLKNTN